MLIFASLVFTIIFGFISVLCLNYSVFLWENKKVNDLTKQIKHTDNQILQKSNVSRNFSSIDLSNNIGKTESLKVVGEFYNKTLVNIKNQDYPYWFLKLVREFNLFRTNIFGYLKRFISYLIHLTTPVHQTTVEPKNVEKELKPDFTSSKNIFEDGEVEVLEVYPNSQEDEELPFSTQKNDSDLATISFIGTDSEKNEKDMNIFEKLESRILEKLKGVGLNHYDIWLELGNLYEKYDEKEKAMEIYALVLKHSSGKEKELARDRLIGLS